MYERRPSTTAGRLRHSHTQRALSCHVLPLVRLEAELGHARNADLTEGRRGIRASMRALRQPVSGAGTRTLK